MKYYTIFQELKKIYTVEDIAESMMIPADLSEEEKQQSNQEIKSYRMEKLKNMSKEDVILSDVMRLRFQIENYINSDLFSFDKTFGKFLEEYIRIVRKTRREIADDLAIHYTKLSRILNEREEPNIELCYRLEKHSANLISAKLWWRLMVKKQEFIIVKDEATKKEEQEKVKNFLRA